MASKKTYLYETHLHTSPVSKCARVSVRDVIEFYRSEGYEGIFITNHFIDGNINIDRSLPYEERINFFFSDYEEGCRIGKELGFSVFCGLEMSYAGTDFLIYGIGKEWFLSHPEFEGLDKRAQLSLLMENAALVIQAHPFREASYIACIRLFPRHVHGVEVYNGCRTEFENRMAKEYADNYGLLHFAGSDNHIGSALGTLGGMQSDTPIVDEADFINRVKNGQMSVFQRKMPQK